MFNIHNNWRHPWELASTFALPGG